MEARKKYQANPVVFMAREPDGAVLYNPETDTASVVNPTGQELWELLAAPRTREEIVQHILDHYQGVSLEQAREDAQGFIETLGPDFLLELDDDKP